MCKLPLVPHSPMKIRSFLLLAALALGTFVRAADLTGHWITEFESPIGRQKYAYDFKDEGKTVTGKATYEHSMGKGENELKELKLAGEDISFVEMITVPDMTIRVVYTGKVTGDEMKLSRQVGDFGTEQLVAKRVKPEAAK
jgi:hypothetical protein